MDQLLKLLEQNAKLTTDQLSALLGKTEEEIASAIKEYEKENVIVGYNALVNWEKIDPNDCTAVIELKVQPKRDHGYDEIAAEIMRFVFFIKVTFLMIHGITTALGQQEIVKSETNKR